MSNGSASSVDYNKSTAQEVKNQKVWGEKKNKHFKKHFSGNSTVFSNYSND